MLPSKIESGRCAGGCAGSTASRPGRKARRGTRPFGWAGTAHLDADRRPCSPMQPRTSGRPSLHSIVREWGTGVTTSSATSGSPIPRLTLANPRLCGWRRLNGEIVKDDAGCPIRTWGGD